MAESLQIEIDIGDAKTQIQDLVASFAALGEATSKIDSKAGNSIQKLADAMQALKPIDTSVADSFTAIGTAMQAIQVPAINELSNSLNKLGRVDMDVVVTNVKKLGDALAELKVPAGLDQIAAAFHNITQAAGNVGTAVKGVKPPVDETQKAFEHLGKELVNAAGYAMGISVSLGQVAGPLSVLRNSSLDIGQIFSGITKELGAFGTATAVLGLAGLAMEVVGEKVKQFGEAVLKATEAYESMTIAIDAMRGKGTGEAEWAHFTEQMNRTGQSLEGLQHSWTKFNETAIIAGLSMQKVAQVEDNLATVTGALGLSAEKASGVYDAFSKMMNKGTITMNELSRALREVPGATTKLAEALGTSVQGLQSMIKSGQVLSSEQLPRLAEALAHAFEPMLEERMRTAEKQMTLFGNAVSGLLQTVGTGGGFGGFAKAFADGLHAITEALNSNAIKAFAAALGILFGLLTGVALGAISGFIQGFTMIVNAVITVVAEIAKAIGSILGLNQEFFNSVSAMQRVVDAATAIGVVLGIMASLWAANKVAVLASAVADGVAWVAKKLLTTSMYEAAAASTALNASLLANPYVRVAALVGILGAALIAYLRSTGEAAHGTDVLGQKIQSMSTMAQLAGGALKEMADGTGKSASNMFEAANATNSFAQSQRDAKGKIEEINSQLRSNKQALLDSNLGTRAAERDTKNYINSLEAQKTALTQGREHMQHQNQDLKDSAKAAHESTKGMDMNHDALKKNQRAVQELDISIKQANQSLQDRKERDDAYRDSIKELDARLEAHNQIMKQYKVDLDAAQISDLKQLESWGMEQQAAVQLVDEYKRLTASVAERAAAADKSAKAAEAEVAFLGQWLTKLQAAIQAERERLKAAGESDEAIKTALTLQTQLEAKLQSMIQTKIKDAAIQGSLNIAYRDNIPVMDAVKQKLTELAQKYGVDIPTAMQVQLGIMDTMGGKTKEHAKTTEDATKKAGESWTTLGKVVETTAGLVGKALIDATTAMVNWLKQLGGGAPEAEKTGKAVKGVGEEADRAGPKIMKLGAAMGDIDKPATAAALDNTEKNLVKVGAAADLGAVGVNKMSTASIDAAKGVGVLASATKEASAAAEADEKFERERAAALGITIPAANGASEAMMNLGRSTHTASGHVQTHTGHIGNAHRAHQQFQTVIQGSSQRTTQFGATLRASGEAVIFARDASMSYEEQLKAEQAALLGASNKQLDHIEKLKELRQVGGSVIEVVTGLKYVYKDVTAANREALLTVEEKIAKLREEKSATSDVIINAEKESAVKKSLVEATKEVIDAMGKGNAESLQTAAATKQRVAEIEAERVAVGRSRDGLNERIKALEEERNAVALGAGPDKEYLARKDAQIAKAKQLFDSSFDVQEGLKKEADALTNTLLPAQSLASNKSSQLIADNAKLGESFSKPAEAVTKGMGTLREYSGELDRIKAVITGGVVTNSVYDESNKKVGETVRDLTGKLLGMSPSLKDSATYTKELADAANPLAEKERLAGEAAAKASDQFKSTGNSILAAKGSFQEFNAVNSTLGQGLLNTSQQFKVFDSAGKEIGVVTRDMKGNITDMNAALKAAIPANTEYATAAKKMAEAAQVVAEKEKAAAAAIAEKKAKTDAATVSETQMKDILAKQGSDVDALREKTIQLNNADKDSAAIEDRKMAAMQAQSAASTKLLADKQAEVDMANRLKDVNSEVADTYEKMKTKMDDCVLSSDGLNNKLTLVSQTQTEMNATAEKAVQGLTKEGQQALVTGQEMLQLAQDEKQVNDNAPTTGGGGGSQIDAQAQSTTQYKSGGIVGQSIDPIVNVSKDIFAGAPKFATGTQNTSIFTMNGEGGGIPSILHPNEAVVPLSGGRSIPVDIKSNDLGRQNTWNMDPLLHAIAELSRSTTGVQTSIDKKVATTLTDIHVGVVTHTKAMKDAAAAAAAGTGITGIATGLNPPPKLIDGPSQRAIHGSDHRRAHPLRQNHDMTGDLILDANVPGMSQTGDGGPSGPAPVQAAPAPIINVTYNSGHFDSFKLTKDQVAKIIGDGLAKVKQQNG